MRTTWMLVATFACAGCVDPGPAGEWGGPPQDHASPTPQPPLQGPPDTDAGASAGGSAEGDGAQGPAATDAATTQPGALDAGASADAASSADVRDATVGHTRGPGDDAGQGVDAGDASLADEADGAADAAAPDPFFDSPSVCTSNTFYLGRDDGSELMDPGQACNACHSRSREAPIYTIAGTLYETPHEPDGCYGANPDGALIHVVDARGTELDLQPNHAGNFMTRTSLSFPLKVAVAYQGKTREMEGPVERADGDCNLCHTETGQKDAPGRIALP